MYNLFKLSEIKDVLDFAKQTNRLSYLERYNTTPHLLKESVSDHSYQVSIISLFLYEKYKNIIKLDFNELIKQALVHDLSESMEYIGDVPHSIKENNIELKNALTLSEYKALEELMGIEYVNYLKNFNELSNNESILVNIADVISCLIYAESEISKGNKYMERVKFESEERLLKFLEDLKKCQ